jgi:hypothetical protein
MNPPHVGGRALRTRVFAAAVFCTLPLALSSGRLCRPYLGQPRQGLARPDVPCGASGRSVLDPFAGTSEPGEGVNLDGPAGNAPP